MDEMDGTSSKTVRTVVKTASWDYETPQQMIETSSLPSPEKSTRLMHEPLMSGTSTAGQLPLSNDSSPSVTPLHELDQLNGSAAEMLP